MEKLIKSDSDQIRENAINKEQGQVKELIRRGSIRHYFLGPENIWSQEGFGTVIGGFFCTILGGILLPMLLLYSSDNVGLKYSSWMITVAGILLMIRGLYGMFKESRLKRKPVPDSLHDEILEYDIEGLKNKSKILLKTNIPKLIDENIDEMKCLIVKGPREYVDNVNLPLIWKLGDDGKIRYSNFSIMVIYFGKENLYIFTSIFNMRNGTSKFQHTYECPYHKIRFVGFQDRVIETVSQQNKAIIQNLQMLIINAGDEEGEELAISIQDYGMIQKLKGVFETGEAEQVVNSILNKLQELK